MPASIGVNLRVTGHCRQGGRKYMEDFFSVAYQQTEDEKDLEYAFFGIYDGHGGAEAAAFAKEHLMESIIKHKNFWSDNDEDVLRAIKDGYIATHYAMWKEQEKWPKTASGLPSTAGTTASVAFIRRGKIYIGHVGDSGIIMGYQEPGCPEWKAKPLTKDHKPENVEEMKRIEGCGGKVVSKSGVPRVVWNRPRIGHQGPVRRSTPIDEIPFLAVARSLGDLWSYNSQINQFIVSPDPDCSVLQIDTTTHRCLVFGTDGLYNMLSPTMAVHIVQQAERHNENATLSDSTFKTWLNPSKLLVERALERWHATKMRADNTSVVTLMLDPPGPPRAQVLKDRKKNLPESGLKILTRYDGNSQGQHKNCTCSKNNTQTSPTNTPATTSNNNNNNTDIEEVKESTNSKNVESKKEEVKGNQSDSIPVTSSEINNTFPLKEHNYVPKPRESTSFDPRDPLRQSFDNGKENTQKNEDNTIQINEISSTNIEESHIEEEPRENDTKNSKPNLRSSKKFKSEPEPEQPKGVKRKLSDSASPIVRKSVRLSRNKKRLSEDLKNLAPCTLAEEKLKKLAEEAEKQKRRSQDNKKPPPKLSLAQKIMKLKKANAKKKDLVKKPTAKRNFAVVVENLLQKSKRKLPEKKAAVTKKPEVRKKQPKVVTTKFQRHVGKNASQRRKTVNNNEKKEGGGKGVQKKKVKDLPKKKQNNAKERESKSLSRSSSSASVKNLTKTSKKENKPPKGVSPKKTIPKQPARTKSLRNRIQEKTATLKKNVLRK